MSYITVYIGYRPIACIGFDRHDPDQVEYLLRSYPFNSKPS